MHIGLKICSACQVILIKLFVECTVILKKKCQKWKKKIPFFCTEQSYFTALQIKIQFDIKLDSLKYKYTYLVINYSITVILVISSTIFKISNPQWSRWDFVRNLQFLSHLAPVGTAAVAACNFETQVQFRDCLVWKKKLRGLIFFSTKNGMCVRNVKIFFVAKK